MAKYLKLSGACEKTETRSDDTKGYHHRPDPPPDAEDVAASNRFHPRASRGLRQDCEKVQDVQFLSDNFEMVYGCVEESDFNLMRTMIAKHKTKLTEAKTQVRHRTQRTAVDDRLRCGASR